MYLLTLWIGALFEGLVWWLCSLPGARFWSPGSVAVPVGRDAGEMLITASTLGLSVSALLLPFPFIAAFSSLVRAK
ncbi:hypothetical protein BC567DRAFT_87397 [Phyllosticta citribraziliensis]